MKFKNTKKSPTQKTSVSSTAKKDINEEELKDEIREIVEETVQEVLDEKLEKETALPKEESTPTPESSVVPTVEEKTEEKLIEPEQNTTEPQIDTVPVVAPVSPEIQPEPTTPIQEEKAETSTTQPVVSTPEVSPVEEPVTNDEATEEVKKRSPWILYFLVLIFLALICGGAYWYLSTQKMLNFAIPGSNMMKSTPSSPSPTAVPSPSTAAVDISKYDVSVLNGGGVPGAAASAKTILSDAGFTVITTGNADASDATNTVIAAKSSVDEQTLEKLTETLEKNYSVSSKALTLDASEDADIVVTIGSSTK